MCLGAPLAPRGSFAYSANNLKCGGNNTGVQSILVMQRIGGIPVALKSPWSIPPLRLPPPGALFSTLILAESRLRPRFRAASISRSTSFSVRYPLDRPKFFRCRSRRGCAQGAAARKSAIRTADRAHRGFRAIHETASIRVLSVICGRRWRLAASRDDVQQMTPCGGLLSIPAFHR